MFNFIARNTKLFMRLGASIFLIGFAWLLFANIYFSVPPHSATVVTRFGKPLYVAMPGRPYFMIPFIDNADTSFDLAQKVLTWEADQPMTVVSADGYQVDISVGLAYVLSETKVIDYFNQQEPINTQVAVLLRGVVKDVMGHYDMDIIVSNREKLQAYITATVAAKLYETYGIQTNWFVITNIKKGDLYTSVVDIRETGKANAEAMRAAAGVIAEIPLVLFNKWNGVLPFGTPK